MSNSKSTWVDFKALRESLSFEQVLRHYGINVQVIRGQIYQGPCPLPNHRGKNDKRSFLAKLDHGVYRCNGGCGTGNQLTFAAHMEALDPSNPQNIRTVALELQEIFGTHQDSGTMPSAAKRKPTADNASAKPRRVTPKIVVNPPLDFELQGLDYDHPYLPKHGFLRETIRTFGLGYCNRGLMKERIAIPLHTHQRQLLGYAGILIDDDAVTDTNPKELFPSNRERNGTTIEFRKDLLLYNLNRVTTRVPDLIVVQNFTSCWWLWQWGYRNVISLMGNECSQDQAYLIASAVKLDGRVWVLTNQTPNGDVSAAEVLKLVAPFHWVRWVKSKQRITDLTPGDLEQLLPGLAERAKEDVGSADLTN